ncbi:MAG: hypothetical protein IJ137_10910 [Eubacterium sp.]|nr:hypothetical protein [Eubacterium sp.]
MIKTALIEGLVWSGLWMFFVYVIMKCFPWEMLHDYPEDVRKASKLSEPDSRQKRNAKIFSGIGSIIIFGALILFGLTYFRNGKAEFSMIFCFLFIIAMSWNVIDLLVMDWLLVCTLRPAWLIIPGTENCSSYEDFGHHFKGFLIGCLYTTIMALVFAGIDYAILHYLIWT